MAPLIPLALTLNPELARWLTGPTADAASAAIATAVQTAVGTADPDAAAAALQHNTGAAADLRIQLAGIAAQMEASAHATILAELAGAAAGPAGALSGPAAWAAPVLSAAVLLTFGTVMTTVLVFGMRPGSETTSNMLLGTLAAMATSVVSYWVGSSAGSARKDDRLAQLSK